jgi:starch-binding outer membrane protein, SusD/RagB family
MKMQNKLKRGRGKALLMLPLVLSTAGCDHFLTVETPGEILAETLDNPKYAQLLATSTVSSFECAFGAYIMTAGALGSELIISGTGSSQYPMDQRTLTDKAPHGASANNPCTPYSLYVPISTARWMADDLRKKLDGEWKSETIANRPEMIGSLAAVAGYSILLLGESMCSAALDLGPEMMPKQLFEEAVKRFDVALSSGASASIINLARIGKGRSLLNLGDAQGAAAVVRAVPVGFVYNNTHSNAVPERRNPVYYSISVTRNPVVDGRYYFDLKFDGVADKRVPVTNPGNLKASDNLVPRWTQTKYPNESAPIPVARYAEAQLIIAEAEGGQNAVNIINALHAAAGLPPFNPAVHKTAGPFGTDYIKNQIVEERKREFFLESHHLGDFRRYNLPQLPAAGTVYPWTGGGFYGDARCFPLPASEKATNPNLSGK